MRKALVLGVLVFLLVLATVNAIDNYGIEFNIVKGKAVVEHTISNSDLQDLEVRLPADASAISVYGNEKAVNVSVSDGYLILPDSDNIRFNYVTKEYLDKQNFVYDFIAPADIAALKLNLVLPENAILKKPFSRGDLTTGSAFPSPSQALTDGKSIVLVWNTDLEKGEEMPVFVGYKEGRNYVPLVVLLVLLLVVAIVYIVLKKPKLVIQKEDLVEEHLKEDEEQIVNVLKQRDGHKIEQGTLRVITGFSKATLSRLLKELEERKVIYKEKRGKKNLIFLKK